MKKLRINLPMSVFVEVEPILESFGSALHLCTHNLDFSFDRRPGNQNVERNRIDYRTYRLDRNYNYLKKKRKKRISTAPHNLSEMKDATLIQKEPQ